MSCENLYSYHYNGVDLGVDAIYRVYNIISALAEGLSDCFIRELTGGLVCSDG